MADSKVEDLSKKLDAITNDYRSDKKTVIAAGLLFVLFVSAFFAVDVKQLPGKIKKELDIKIKEETGVILLDKVEELKRELSVAQETHKKLKDELAIAKDSRKIVILTGDVLSGTTEKWKLQNDKSRASSVEVKFDKAFSTKPKVILYPVGFSITGEHHALNVWVTEVDTEGFKANFATWGSGDVGQVWAKYVAIEA